MPLVKGNGLNSWVTANMPWGVLGVGKRPWRFGTALQYDGSDSLTTESISLTVPYGPFDIGIAYYPFRFAGRSPIRANTSEDNTLAYADPYDLPAYPTPGGLPAQDYSQADRSGSFSNDFLLYLNYSNGPLSAGVLCAYGSYHIGPEATLLTAGQSPYVVPLDADLFHGTIYEKYNNGRFFLNSELAWLCWTDRFGAAPINSIYPYTPYGTDLAFPQIPSDSIRRSVESGDRNRSFGRTG